MKKTIAVSLVLLSGLILTGCGQTEENQRYWQREKDKYMACLEAGGSYYHHGNDNSYECITEENK